MTAIEELDETIEKLMAPAVSEAIAVNHKLADNLLHYLSKARVQLAATRPQKEPRQQ